MNAACVCADSWLSSLPACLCCLCVCLCCLPCCQVQGLLVDLGPRDTLLVPAYWCVHSQLMQPACVGLEVGLTQGPDRLSSPAALLLQASRMLELWFGAEAGPANIRKWLLVRRLGSCCHGGSDCGRCFSTQYSVTNMHVHMHVHHPSSLLPNSCLKAHWFNGCCCAASPTGIV